ncbi:hypothetical protein [Candidatus Protochlamydia phocaeensis]|uniref:hypothetical protein n=1 Tax=Candidatus Protochlamydia phocaeensis TaxID=1414722 RepID=UPI0008380AD3|nr:hypothetical protein [Candidatus Protochlamydia phocaeensis]
MNTNDPKFPQDPDKPPFQDPNQPSSGDPSDLTQPPVFPSSEPSKIYSTNASNYAVPPKSAASTEPNRVYASEMGEGAKTYSSDYTQKTKDYQHKESIEDKVRESFRNNKDSKKFDDLYQYARNNKEHTITYILLILGLLLLFFDNLLGGLILGMVAGYHFAYEIIYYLRNIGQVFTGQDQLRYVVLTGLLLGLFIAAPGIFVGAIIVAAFKQVMQGKGIDTPPPSDRDSGPTRRL